ncbi:hypothetical protein ACWNG8_08675 [Aeromonas veronii]
MKKKLLLVIVSTFIFGCAKHEVVSVDGQDTNRWKIIKDWNGNKGWIGATYEDDTGGLAFESFQNDVMFSLLKFNKSDCDNVLVVDGVTYNAQPKKEQKAGYSVCIQYVTGDKAFEIAAKMAMSKTVNFNGHDTDVRGFESIMNNYFIKSGVAPTSFGREINSLAALAGVSQSNDMSFSGSGNWKIYQGGDMTMAGLKSISDSKSAIIVARSNDTFALSFIEPSPYEGAQCSDEVVIGSEHFKVKPDKHSENGDYSCVYIMQGSDAEYAFSLTGKNKTTYINGVVFDTSGFDQARSKISN